MVSLRMLVGILFCGDCHVPSLRTTRRLMRRWDSVRSGIFGTTRSDSGREGEKEELFVDGGEGLANEEGYKKLMSSA